jgi:hypothetical protein
MAAPLHVSQYELDPRPFTLQHLAARVNDQGFDVGEHHRSAGWRAEDGFEGFACRLFMVEVLSDEDSSLDRALSLSREALAKANRCCCCGINKLGTDKGRQPWLHAGPFWLAPMTINVG